MSFEYSKLLGRIKEKCGSQAVFALKMELSERTTSLKLSAKRDWKRGEIIKACEILEIPEKEIYQYFFKTKVQN